MLDRVESSGTGVAWAVATEQRPTFDTIGFTAQPSVWAAPGLQNLCREFDSLPCLQQNQTNPNHLDCYRPSHGRTCVRRRRLPAGALRDRVPDAGRGDPAGGEVERGREY